MYASPARFLLTQMVSVAELEAGLISERTKPRWRPAKAREVKLGNPACVSQDHWLWCDTRENSPLGFEGT
jgi:DNA invertase Pin-like site-specific DNA recombinase